MSEEQTVNVHEYINSLKENTALKSIVIHKLEEKIKHLEEINDKKELFKVFVDELFDNSIIGSGSHDSILEWINEILKQKISCKIYAINFDKNKWTLTKAIDWLEMNKINIDKYKRVKREDYYRFEINDFDKLDVDLLTGYYWIKERMHFIVPKHEDFYFNAKFNY
eukprot:gene6617-10783_t